MRENPVPMPWLWPYTTSLVNFGHPLIHSVYLKLSSTSNCRFSSS